MHIQILVIALFIIFSIFFILVRTYKQGKVASQQNNVTTESIELKKQNEKLYKIINIAVTVLVTVGIIFFIIIYKKIPTGESLYSSKSSLPVIIFLIPAWAGIFAKFLDDEGKKHKITNIEKRNLLILNLIGIIFFIFLAVWIILK